MLATADTLSKGRLIGGDGGDYQGTAGRLELFATEAMARFQ
ncbi:MAG: hypothetical protein O2967_09205 [Proteobacteria bacterium]|nr:hypothetical protein [Pseudomonadota bacterium]